MKEEKRPKRDPMRAVASFIVEKRVIFYLVFLAAVIFCALSVGKVRINSDLTAFLPAEAETRRGLAVMEAEFDTYAAAQVMVSNVTYEQAEQLAGRLRERILEEKPEGVEEIIVSEINPTIGAHIGPDAVGVVFLQRPDVNVMERDAAEQSEIRCNQALSCRGSLNR